MKNEDKFLWIFGSIFFCIFLISGSLLLNYFLETHKQKKINEELSKLKHGYELEYFSIVEGEPIEPVGGTVPEHSGRDNQYKNDSGAVSQKEEYIPGLSDINPDYVFWIEIPDTSIDYPVVYKDNEYYLRRDFYGEKNKHGTIFLDENCDADGTFMLIHGHNMKDGTMFGGLRDFKKADYRSRHTELVIGYERSDVKYKIVAGMLVDLYDTNRFVYEKMPGTNEEAEIYFSELVKHTLWCEDFEWETGKRVVLLSTCDYGTQEQRFVIIAIEE